MCQSHKLDFAAGISIYQAAAQMFAACCEHGRVEGVFNGIELVADQADWRTDQPEKIVAIYREKGRETCHRP